MIRSLFAWVGRWLYRLWRVIDVSRRLVLNLIFFGLLTAIIVAASHNTPPILQNKTTLVLTLSGRITEQRNGDDRASFMRALESDEPSPPLLRDVVSALDHAATDPHITQAVLNLDDLRGAGMASLHEIADAMDRFKAKGKPITAWSSTYEQGPYYLAVHANHVYAHPMGNVLLKGFGGLRSYYRDALDKLGITVNLIRVGTFKSAAEPFIANGPSEPAQQAAQALYGDLWATYLNNVEAARKLPAGALMSYINNLPQLMDAAGGDAGMVAVQLKLLDGLKTWDEVTNDLIKTGAPDDATHSYRAVTLQQYLKHIPSVPVGDAIGVIVAEGEIVDGVAQMGSVGGRSTSDLIRKARLDDHVKAVVLRVNSPGGSAYASELIRHELELVRRAGKPVVVSMGDVAASGGYWISMSSDKVMADAGTITGSIGVFALVPTAEKAFDKVGVHSAGVSTTWLTNAGDPSQALDPRFAALMQLDVNHIYSEFTRKAAQARKTDPASIDAVAQGRVWTGKQAKDNGLIDQVGSMGDAVKAAAQLAKMKGTPRLQYIEPDPGRFAAVLDALSNQTEAFLAAQFDVRLGPIFAPPKVARDMRAELGWLADLSDRNKPFASVTHCFCTAP